MSPDFKKGRDISPLLRQMFEEEVERFLLPNGLTVLLKEDHSSQLSSVQIWVRTGSMHEGNFLGGGLSHFLEHMLFKGTEERPGARISREVQAAGGYHNAYTTFDRTVFHIDLPSESTLLAFELLADAAFNSVLPPAEVEKERAVIRREIDMGRDDPDARVSRALFENAFREHPYRYPVIGYRELFDDLKREDLEAYYRARYLPNNMAVVGVGDFDTAFLRQSIEETFGQYPRRTLPPPYIAEEPPQLAFREERLFDEVRICRGALGYKIHGVTHPDTPALDLLAAVLGGGHSSILWKKLREERKLVHSLDVASWSPGAAGNGLFWISYLCEIEKREMAQRAIGEEIAALAHGGGITREKLDKARKQALVGEINLRKTMSGQASRLGLSECVIGDIGYPMNYFRRLEALEPADLEKAVDRYLVPERLTAVSLNAASAPRREARKPPAPSRIAHFESLTLENGARLLHYRTAHLPKLHIRVACLGGPLYESPEERGITGLLATLLTRDAGSRDSGEVSEAIEKAGGVFNEFAGNNTFGFSLEVMPEDWELAMDLLNGAILSPRFKRETLATERDAQIASLKEDLDDIFGFGKKRLRKLFFGEHPYGIDSLGTVESLLRMTPHAVGNHYRKLVAGPNLVLSLAGDFEEGRMLPPIEELLLKLSGETFTPSATVFKGPSHPGEHTAILPREQAVVFQAYPDTGIADPRFPVGELLCELWSEMSGVLFTRVREERSLAYFVGASRLSGVGTGMFFIYAGTHPRTIKDVFEEFDQEIERVGEERVGEEELRRCRNRLKARKRMGLQTIGASALQAALNALYGLPVNDWESYDERIGAITVSDLKGFVLEHFPREGKVNLVVRPE